LANQPLDKDSTIDIVSNFQAKNVSPMVAKVLNYKNALNYVREYWSANPAQVTFETVKELSDTLGVNYGSRQAIEPLLAYLQTGQIHPVIQAALAHLYFYPNRSAYLLSLLFLARAGYDLRGWLSLEDCWSQNRQSYLQVLQQSTTAANSTIWIEYFCQALIVQMTAIKTDLQNLSINISQRVTKSINGRQKDILALAEQADGPITNRQVQAAFNVSQITASRDLAKLSIVGLLAAHGSGRSTSYTKI
jgi:Fic family protein